jgi:hypothetical protein
VIVHKGCLADNRPALGLESSPLAEESPTLSIVNIRPEGGLFSRDHTKRQEEFLLASVFDDCPMHFALEADPRAEYRRRFTPRASEKSANEG